MCQFSVAGTVNGALSSTEALPEAQLSKALSNNTSKNKLDESFLDTLMRCQVSVHLVDVSSWFI